MNCLSALWDTFQLLASLPRPGGARILCGPVRRAHRRRHHSSFFMNKFRQLGFIDYNGGIAVHSSLLNVVLHDQPQIRI